jgi:hypothetical protein
MFNLNIRKRCHSNWLTRANISRAVKGAQNESGSVESALVLIPLLILFLITMQIGVAINFRNLDRAFAQSEASERAISGQYLATDQLIEINPLGLFNTFGLLLSKKESNIPTFIPYFGNLFDRAHHTDVTGIAVIENLS